MRDDFRAVTRLPALTQFLLAPLPALLAGLAYSAWRWTESTSSARADQYHALGWTVLPLVGVTAALFTAAVSRGVEGKRSARWLAATVLAAASVMVLAYARTAALSA